MTLAHPFDDTRVFRLYEPHELRQQRYPVVWDKLGDGHDDLLNMIDSLLPGKYVGVKDVVRSVARLRCQRCGHPYRPGTGTWAPKDDALRPAFSRGLRTGLAPDVQLMFHASELIAGFENARIPDRDRAEREDYWSPCDHSCTHPGPFRCRRPPLDPLFPEGGWTVYGPDAPDASERIRAGMETQAAWRILTVHHLNERKFDLRWWNLAALCQRCHLTIQRKVTMEDPWPWEHSEWFKPHAACWYALRYLGENLTYTATMARLDELLALGQREETVERMPL